MHTYSSGYSSFSPYEYRTLVLGRRIILFMIKAKRPLKSDYTDSLHGHANYYIHNCSKQNNSSPKKIYQNKMKKSKLYGNHVIDHLLDSRANYEKPLLSDLE